MKKIIPLLLVCLLLLTAVGCGDGTLYAARTDTAHSDAVDDQEPSDEEVQAESAEASSSARDNITASPDALLVENQDSYDAPYCFLPEEDGSYHFCASTADDFLGSAVGYDQDILAWTIYVLDEPWEAGWAQLEQSCRPAVVDLTGSTDLALRAGQAVYCVCSLNDRTGDPAADGAGVLSIARTNASMLPDESNGFYRLIDLNAQCEFDLDGDGTPETIYYEVQTNFTGSSGILMGAQPVSLLVNDTEYLHASQDNPMEAFGFWMEDPLVDSYAVVDLDSSDDYYELAIGDQGSNGLTMTHFFRYEDGALRYLGYCSGLLEDRTVQLNGDGSLTAVTALNVLQSWSAWCPYQLQNGQLHQLVGKFVQPQTAVSRTVVLRQSVTAYEKPDLESAQLVLDSSAAVSFLLTDGEHWVQIACADGSTGWIFCPEFSLVLNDGVLQDASELFSNLFLAG